MKNIHPQLHDSIRQSTPVLKKLAAAIHADPELGFQEVRACRLQVERLRSWGFKVQAPFARLSTAYKATQGRGSPVFCFMAEYDALPKLGHGCGHNLIAAAALGAGRALADVLRKEKRPGTVVIMGTPGEEGLGGKVKLVQAGALKGLDAVLMAHPKWRTEPDTGSNAIQRLGVRFHGKSAHAAASPELGRNALDAVILLFQGVNAWRQQLPESSRVHGIVTNGGAAANIIPDLAAAEFYLRSPDDAVLSRMVDMFLSIVEGAALMTGTRAETIPSKVPYRARRPSPVLNDAYLEAADALGLNPIVPDQPGRASSDFGDVSQVVPGAHVYFGISRRPIAAHSTDFLKAAASAYGMQQMIRVAEAMAHVGYRYFTDAPFQASVAEEFQSRQPTAG